MKKYLFVIPTLRTGGAERAVSIFANTLCNQGREAVILKYYNEDDEYPIDERIKIKCFVKGKEEYQKNNFFRKVKFVRKVIKEEKPDFVIPFLYYVARCVDLATIGMNVKVIQSIRSNPEVFPQGKREKKHRNRLVAKSYLTLVQNEEQKKYFDNKLHNKVFVLFNPISDDWFDIEHRGGETFEIISAGRLEKIKNFELLISAFGKAFSSEEKVFLSIYGEGSLKDELEDLIIKKGLTEKVKLKGRTNDMKKVLARADMFVLSSNFEGMPNALIEAMASGVPSISTDCPTGPSDIIENGKNGILVPTGDEETMIGAMKKMYEDVLLRQQFSIEGRRRIKEICNAEEITKKMIEICEEYR